MNQQNLYRPLLTAGIITTLLLAIPLIAMQFSTTVNWSLADFIIAAVLIFTTIFTWVFVAGRFTGIAYKLAVAAVIGATFLLVWVNIAVGLIGAGPSAANLMYIAVAGIVTGGAIVTRFTARGMERVMFAACCTIVLIALLQLTGKMYEASGGSAKEVIAVNAFFAALFAAAALLFRYVPAKNVPHTGE
ncbi:hypothetical protein I5907_18355 [Panacibacter sp. DH6]|uniref:Uncharacterized protein n=1 Tax=Panacibacter microcysteis TaxID=2793269 RepID=A0A931GZH8_9BACT|nr:hypothetical protein [Panacibacter microcysteis]MBG9378207.1 hypothetical protein [Panacibacter microcysteis]